MNDVHQTQYVPGAGFERATVWSSTKCSPRLSYPGIRFRRDIDKSAKTYLIFQVFLLKEEIWMFFQMYQDYTIK